MKRLITLALAGFVLLCITPVSAAEQSILLYLNGKSINTSVGPKMIEGNTYVDEEFIRDHLGAKLTKNDKDGKATILKGNTTIELVNDSKDAIVNGKAKTLSAAPKNQDGAFMVPIRSLADELDVKVVWDSLTKSIFVYTRSEVASAAPPETLMPAVSNDSNTGVSGVDNSNGVNDETPAANESNMGSAVIDSIRSEGGRIVIQGPGGKLSPNVFYLTNPDRIVLDFPDAKLGATLNGLPAVQNGFVELEHPMVRNVRYAMFASDPSTVRIVIDLAQPVKYKVVPDDAAGQVFIDLATTIFKVVIDAGHGGHDPGATGKSGAFEKHFTLAVSEKIFRLLQEEPSIQPVMTRTDDTYIALEERAAVANKLGADLFLSVHGNNYGNSAIRGIETYYYKDKDQSVAETLHKYILETTGFPDRSARKANFKVLRDTAMPSALLELGYLSNAVEEQQLLTDAFQEKLAKSIVSGIKQYLQIR